jgi:hypothetical protein
LLLSKGIELQPTCLVVMAAPIFGGAGQSGLSQLVMAELC